jgi:hypothetical protein
MTDHCIGSAEIFAMREIGDKMALREDGDLDALGSCPVGELPDVGSIRFCGAELARYTEVEKGTFYSLFPGGGVISRDHWITFYILDNSRFTGIINKSQGIPTIRSMPPTGLEPVTRGFSVHCSTN